MIRVATVDDADAIARVQVAGWHAAYRGLMPDVLLDRHTVAARAPRWRHNLAEAERRRRTTVFERGGAVIGFTTAGPSREEDGVGEIWALYAHPDAWGTGVGRALLADAVAFLLASHATVHLWVLRGNARAIRFYETAGFSFDGGRSRRHGGRPIAQPKRTWRCGRRTSAYEPARRSSPMCRCANTS